MTVYDILNRLEGVKAHGERYMACCPNHGDRTPSLSVSQGKDGRILLKCFGGCATEDVVRAMGLSMEDLFPEPAPNKAAPKSAPKAESKTAPGAVREAEYAYAGGRLKKGKYRRPDGSKFCVWQHWDGQCWQKGRKGMAPGLYGSGDGPMVFLVEGEKDVDTLQRAGMPAVSLPDGAQSQWEPEYDGVFRGKQVAILPDNDEPGRKYAQMCAENLYGKADCIWLMDLGELWREMPPKGDVSDMVQELGQEETLRRIADGLNHLPPWKPEEKKPDAFLSMFKPLTDFEEQEADWLIPGWVPEGQITLLAADGGVGKTSLWCDIIAGISAGRPCILDPEGYNRQPQKVAFCTTEDSVRKKLLRKLRQAGANMRNIIAMDTAADASGELRQFKFGNPYMEKFIRHCRPALCVFDPVQGFLPPEVNMASRNAMRDCMAPLITLGEETGTTFLVICHTNKRKAASGRDRIADSADLWDIARSVLMAGYTEEQGIRYLSNEKNNYAALQQTLLFSIGEEGGIRKEGKTWKRDRDYTTESTTAKSQSKREKCKEFLRETLEGVPNRCMKANDLIQEAKRHGYCDTTINRAKTDLQKENIIETIALGSARKKNRTFYTRLKSEAERNFQELPFDTPTPFDAPTDRGK